MFKKLFKNQKGFTLVEILVVIVIIGILFLVILPRIDFAGDAARQTGVKTDFRNFATSGEAYLRETAGRSLVFDTGLNRYLDPAMQVDETRDSLWGNTGGPQNLYKLSNKKDPWGVEYEVELTETTSATGAAVAKIVVRTYGKGKAGTNRPDFISASYYYQGYIDACTEGFGSGDIQAQTFTFDAADTNGDGFTCGENVTGLINP